MGDGSRPRARISATACTPCLASALPCLAALARVLMREVKVSVLGWMPRASISSSTAHASFLPASPRFARAAQSSIIAVYGFSSALSSGSLSVDSSSMESSDISCTLFLRASTCDAASSLCRLAAFHSVFSVSLSSESAAASALFTASAVSGSRAEASMWRSSRSLAFSAASSLLESASAITIASLPLPLHGHSPRRGGAGGPPTNPGPPVPKPLASPTVHAASTTP
mmetsp:Transcript_30606/g.77061  ORF Transcript_30606/g.77061 Transcript_30606/m.77061 type:complete len:227 (-) Transcript_30606:17-697(-)